jgi:hypothetical protein
MVSPGSLGETTNLFICGNDEGAKEEVAGLLQTFGWVKERITDVGDITAARGTEMYLPLWLRLYGLLGTGEFNIGIVKSA